LIARIHGFRGEPRCQKLPQAAKKNGVWKRRYREINDWERYLTDNGFRIVKVREPARRGSPRSPSVERWSSR
jgi:polyphosphate kinase 2 (PPK2 family)